MHWTDLSFLPYTNAPAAIGDPLGIVREEKKRFNRRAKASHSHVPNHTKDKDKDSVEPFRLAPPVYIHHKF